MGRTLSSSFASASHRNSRVKASTHHNTHQQRTGRMAHPNQPASQSDVAMGNESSVTGGQGQGLQITPIPRNRIPHGYNNNYTVKLTYADNYKVEIQYGVAGVQQIWATNDIFDPDLTGTGHQPLSRDTWASLYGSYAVMACDYDIELYNCCTEQYTYTAVASNQQRLGTVNVTLLPSTDTGDFTGPAGSTTIFPAAELKNGTTRMLCPEEKLRFTGSLEPGDFLMDAIPAQTDTTWTAVGSSPALRRHLGLIFTSFGSAGTLVGVSEAPISTIFFTVKLDYYVQFADASTALRRTAS